MFDASQLYVEGILVAGDDDFVTVAGCTRSKKCPDNGCNGADVTRTTLFDDLIPVQTTYHVHFGTPGNLKTVGIVGDRDWYLPPLAPNTTYRWQIERRNACGTALGPEWEFTTGNLATPHSNSKHRSDLQLGWFQRNRCEGLIESDRERAESRGNLL